MIYLLDFYGIFISCILPVAAVTGLDFPSHSWLFQKPWTYDFRISFVDTKHGLEVPVSVNQDEKELLLTKSLENPFLWYETEFPKELELAGMKKEMESMLNFEVFSEVPATSLSDLELSHAISSRWVKTRKPDGTVRCRFVVRGFDQVVEDPNQSFTSTPSLTTYSFDTFCCIWLECVNRRNFYCLFTCFDHRRRHFCDSTCWILSRSKHCLEVEACTLWLQEFSKTLARPLCDRDEEAQL